ncbi:hypothetical protein D7D52_17225 [Nocardia yunnanensis]|uniref:Uncharacterized protein n=1 Tax=Nocardia yunnanensis TaxID=2382165 RepID=A0A386ZDX8_9NOCA|nr:hypothetical protein D7D52_17225 [Nocardia yunnanensis]
MVRPPHRDRIRRAQHLPSPLAEVVDRYCSGDHLTAWTAYEYLLIDMVSDDYDGDWEESAEDRCRC